eukprot:332887-Pelagomonas_calceolata.AAC.2
MQHFSAPRGGLYSVNNSLMTMPSIEPIEVLIEALYLAATLCQIGGSSLQQWQELAESILLRPHLSRGVPPPAHSPSVPQQILIIAA